MKLELPEVPDITDISKFTIKRDEKILEKIIKPKDDLIKELYRENLSLNKELSKQSKVVDEAVKYQKARNTIMADNRALHLEVDNIKKKYKEKETDMKWDYENEIKDFENETRTFIDQVKQILCMLVREKQYVSFLKPKGFIFLHKYKPF